MFYSKLALSFIGIVIGLLLSAALFYIYEITKPIPIEQQHFVTITRIITPTIHQATDDDLAKIAEQQFHQLREGVSIFNPPSDMNLGETKIVRLRIAKPSSNSSISSLKGHLLVGLEKNRLNLLNTFPVSTKMNAKLTGDKFNVTPLTNEEQFIVNDNYSEWSWTIEPTEAGKHNLNLSISVVTKLEDKESVKYFPVKTVVVNINVTWLHYLLSSVKEHKGIIDNSIGGVLTIIIVGLIIKFKKLLNKNLKKVLRSIKKKKRKIPPNN